MTELGTQLEREGSRVELEPGALERFEDRVRRRQRIRQVGVYLLAFCVCVLGVVSVVAALSARTDPSPATPPSPPAVNASEVLPPGKYWTAPLTRSQLEATLRTNGFGTKREVNRFFKDLGPFSQTVRFGIQVQENGIWNQFQQLDEGGRKIAWAGAYRATGSHEITVFGYGCSIKYDISRSAGKVAIRVLNEQGPSYDGMCGQRDLAAQIAIYHTAAFLRRS
jgi:hypothetical protein